MDDQTVKNIQSQIDQGIELSYLDDKLDEIKTRLDHFAKQQFSCSIFLSGLPGSGKTFLIRRALRESNLDQLWTVTIDCRLFDTDKSAMKEFLRQTKSPPNRPILDSLKMLGAGIIVFDHFDSIKIIKRQFFLYTLFDSIHTNSVALCVVVLTSSHEPLNNLEKRVKSRFTPFTIDLPSPIEFDMDNFIQLLTSEETTKTWNDSVKNNFTKKGNSRIKHPFPRLYMLSPSLHTAMLFAKKLAFYIPQQKLTLKNIESTVNEMIDTINPRRFLEGMSHIDLIVVFISVYMQAVKLMPDFTFDNLFDEIESQFRPFKLAKIFTSDRVRIAWDKLLSMKLLVVVSKDGTKVSTTIYEDDIEQLISSLPTEAQVWSKQWLKASYKEKK